MNEEDRTESAINRGNQAEELMRNPLILEAFAKLAEDYTSAWRNARKQEDREICWHRINLLGNLRDHFRTVIQNGKLSQQDLKLRVVK